MTLRIDQNFRWGWLIALPGISALLLVLLAKAPSLGAATILFLLVILLTSIAVRCTGDRRHNGLRTIDGLLKTLVEGDYSVRASALKHDDELRRVLGHLNELASRLQDEQRSQQEHLHLLSKTLASLDGAVLVFEHEDRLVMINPAGEKLLGASNHLGLSASELGIEHLFNLTTGSVWCNTSQGKQIRLQVSHTLLRRRSKVGRLLVLQPIEQALREEEAQAFRKLLRVVSHEINNSLAPIGSMADTLRQIIPRPGEQMEEELFTDMRHAFDVIGQRSSGLQNFIAGYAQLARLPPPKSEAVSINKLCDDVTRLIGEDLVEIGSRSEARAQCDPVQVTQVLINLLRNAIDSGGKARVCLRWEMRDGRVAIDVIDSGHGLPSSGNLFVPFFTTKPGGAGIGLALSRSIIEAQEGTLVLKNREDGRGAIATITLPARGN